MKTVNFIDAVNSGRRFRQYTYESWLIVNKLGEIVNFKTTIPISLTVKLVNSQFELEEQSIAITESAFNKALLGTIGGTTLLHVDVVLLKKELGFK